MKICPLTHFLSMVLKVLSKRVQNSHQLTILMSTIVKGTDLLSGHPVFDCLSVIVDDLAALCYPLLLEFVCGISTGLLQ